MDPEAPSPLTPNTLSPQPAPSEAPAVASPEAPIDATWQSPLKQIRTYQGDVANAIHGQQESLVSIRAAEKARADLLRTHAASDGEAEAEKKSRIRAALLVLGSLVLLAAAVGAGWYAYTTYLVKTAVPVVEIPKNRLLPVVSTKNVDASSLGTGALAALLAEERAKTIAPGNVEHVELLKSASSTELLNPTELMLYLGARTPGNLVRSFDKIFMLGVIGGAENETFLLMKLDSYENAYAGMLDWEKDLRTDLLPLMRSQDELASSTPGTGWTDVTIENKDARELKDASGKTELIYSFYNQNLLIITASEDALKTLLAELDTQALAR